MLFCKQIYLFSYIIPKSGRKSTVKMKKTEFFFRGKRRMASATDFPGGGRQAALAKPGKWFAFLLKSELCCAFKKSTLGSPGRRACC